MFICKIDNTNLKSLRSLSSYVKNFNLSLIEYYIQYESFIIPKCPYCEKNCKVSSGINFRKTCGDKLCKTKIFESLILSEETKNKIRIGRINYLNKKLGKTAYEKRAVGEMSYLEKTFFDICKSNDMFSKYDIISEYSVYPYFIDFAFINEKIAVELDGRCHFNNGNERIEHDIKRDDILISKGWKMFRIKFNDNINDKFLELLNFIGNSNMSKNYDDRLYFYTEIKKERYLEYKKIQKMKKDAIYATNLEINKIKIHNIKHSNIDFSKFGWVTKVSIIIDKRPQKVNLWMKRNMPEFYETQCFKRKES